jgi:hypothetical protein
MLSASRGIGWFDGFVQRGNVLMEHSHNAAEIGRYPSGFGWFIEMSKVGLHLSSVS